MAIHFVLFLLALTPSLSALYLLFLTLLSAAVPCPQPQSRSLRFDILIPAHDEATVIASTIGSLQALNWPRENYRLIVIADNCSDNTADIARNVNALVIERNEPNLRGKGYAIAFGADYSAHSGFADAIVVVDADSLASPNLLEAFAARIEQGAQALQANYGVSNPDASWRTRLMTIAYAAFHAVRGRARERLSVSCGLRGNGMSFTHGLLAMHPLQTFSLTEDIEQGVVLGLQGIRVWHVDEARIDTEIPSSGGNAASQRARWEFGRLELARKHAKSLFYNSIKNSNKISLDLAVDLVLPPLSHLALLNSVLLLAALLLPLFIGFNAFPWLTVALINMLIYSLYIFRGWQLCPLGLRALLTLFLAPFFMLWKLLILLKSSGKKQWVKTRRNAEEDAP
ncbi:MAG: glycosyltransferase family 2 protein [Pigmentiphaga sp.]